MNPKEPMLTPQSSTSGEKPQESLLNPLDPNLGEKLAQRMLENPMTWQQMHALMGQHLKDVAKRYGFPEPTTTNPDSFTK